jgi:hypothetical protein
MREKSPESSMFLTQEEKVYIATEINPELQMLKVVGR